MYPMDKYNYYTNGRKVIAVSTYAGRTVRGVATCDPNDTFDMEKGKQLAAARCALKIANKRVARAARKLDEADMAVALAERHADRMDNYLTDAYCEQAAAEKMLNQLTQSM